MSDIDEKDYEAIRKIYEFEQKTPKKEWYLGWEWAQVALYTGTINRLIVKGYVERSFSSHSTKCYKLTDRGRTIAQMELPEAAKILGGQIEAVALPEASFDAVFKDIVGYDDIKELLTESLQTEKPIHVLLHGPPSIAKSMFLLDIERISGEYGMWLIGSATSRAGLWDALAERRPRWVLIDELDKMPAADHAALLSLMETGRLVRTKVGRKLDEKMDVWVIASANRINKLSSELLSRFSIHRLEEYSASEFRQVVTNGLVTHEAMDEDTAAEIATYLLGKTHDVRDAVRVARLSKRVGVKRAVELLIR